MKKNVIILGSTGSIGLNTLEVLSIHTKNYSIFALVANSSVNKLFKQCQKFNPKYVYMNKEGCGKELISLIKNANSIWLNGKPLKKDLEKKLNRKINLENDANCFALSEAVDGTGKGKNIVFGVIIGTGTGGGIIINQKIIKGMNNIAGEWGHISLPNRSEEEIKYNHKCYCSRSGCMETYVSGPGFANSYNLRHNTNLDSQEIVNDCSKNSKSAKALENYVDHLARGLSIVVNILDPEIIVLGGGMSNVDYIYENINNKLKQYVFTDTFQTKVVKNIHGDSGGVRGAAWLS